MSTYGYILGGYNLEVASAQGDLRVVQEILDSLPYSNIQVKMNAALCNAVMGNHAQVVLALLSAGADVNAPDQNGITPLMYAAQLGHLQVVRELLQQDHIMVDYECHGTASTEGTALIVACRAGHEDIINALLDAGADPNAHFPCQESPLTQCAQHPQVLLPVIQRLVSMGADINHCSDHGIPAVHAAALRRCPQTTLFLLENGADLKSSEVQHGPILHRITSDKLSKNQCFCATKETIKALIKYNADELNCQSTSGDTPLLSAVRRGNIDCVLTLLKLNADPDIKNKQKQTALQLALANDIPNKTKIVRMLMLAECSLQRASTVATAYDVFTKDNDVYQEVKTAKSNPRTLKRACRRSIRRHLGSHLEKIVMAMNITDELKDFLMLREVPDISCICQRDRFYLNSDDGCEITVTVTLHDDNVSLASSDQCTPIKKNNNQTNHRALFMERTAKKSTNYMSGKKTETNGGPVLKSTAAKTMLNVLLLHEVEEASRPRAASFGKVDRDIHAISRAFSDRMVNEVVNEQFVSRSTGYLDRRGSYCSQREFKLGSKGKLSEKGSKGKLPENSLGGTKGSKLKILNKLDKSKEKKKKPKKEEYIVIKF